MSSALRKQVPESSLNKEKYMIDWVTVQFSKKGTGIAYSDLHQAHSENLNGRVMNQFGILSLISHLSGFGLNPAHVNMKGLLEGTLT